MVQRIENNKPNKHHQLHFECPKCEEMNDKEENKRVDEAVQRVKLESKYHLLSRNHIHSNHFDLRPLQSFDPFQFSISLDLNA